MIPVGLLLTDTNRHEFVARWMAEDERNRTRRYWDYPLAPESPHKPKEAPTVASYEQWKARIDAEWDRRNLFL